MFSILTNQIAAHFHSRFLILAVLSAAFGILQFHFGADHETKLRWVQAVGNFAGQELPLSSRAGWGESHSAVEIHATVNNDPSWMWRVAADLPDDFRIGGGTITLLLAQPDWAVVDESRNVHVGADGVDIRILAETASGPESIREIALRPATRTDHRQWIRVSFKVPAGGESLVVEALPGPAGSNNWHDRVFIAAKDVKSVSTARSQLIRAGILATFLYLAGLIFYHLGKLARQIPNALGVRVLVTSNTLLITLLGIRVASSEFVSAKELPAKFVLLAHSDAIYVGSLTGLCFVLLYICRLRMRVPLILYRVFLLIGVVSISVGVVNNEIIRLLGGPFNYQWLYYSDYLSGQTARASLLAYVPSSTPLLGSLVVANAIFVAVTLLFKARSRVSNESGTYLAMTAVVLIGLCVLAPSIAKGTRDYDSLKMANPVSVFLKSTFAGHGKSQLFTMHTPVGTEDFDFISPKDDETPGRTAPKVAIVRNVVMFVLESGAAEYISDSTGKPSRIAPEIHKTQRHAATFRNIYAHVPASNKSLVSLLSSVYPMISYTSLTQQAPRAPLGSLSETLKKNAYRTGFFSSGDFRFQRGDEYLAHQQFDEIVAYKNLKCSAGEFRNSSHDWPFQNSVDDSCLFAPFTDWVSKDSNRPFFAVLWPVQMHHPYSVVGPELDFGAVSRDFNRYLNALHQTDRFFGSVMDWLRSRGDLDTTLVVVVGDHGEAFGQHGQWIHASHIYEENIRVPLMLINRRLFGGQQYDTVGGLVDIVPTVLDLLNVSDPTRWQGRSLFASSRSSRTYFFCTVYTVSFRHARRIDEVDYRRRHRLCRSI